MSGLCESTSVIGGRGPCWWLGGGAGGRGPAPTWWVWADSAGLATGLQGEGSREGMWREDPPAAAPDPLEEPSCLSPCTLSGERLRRLQQVLRHQLHELQERLPHLGAGPLLPPVPREPPRRPPLTAAHHPPQPASGPPRGCQDPHTAVCALGIGAISGQRLSAGTLRSPRPPGPASGARGSERGVRCWTCLCPARARGSQQRGSPECRREL